MAVLKNGKFMGKGDRDMILYFQVGKNRVPCLLSVVCIAFFLFLLLIFLTATLNALRNSLFSLETCFK